MKLLVTGGSGQLGRALARTHAAVALDRADLDITSPARIAAALDTHAPTVVINAAAYTAVDRAESERAHAFAVNAEGAAHVARACAARGISLVHVSTDYVFDGAARRPYREGDEASPVNAYGESKLAGERAVLAEGGTVVRTAWLFGHGGPSFVHAIARAAREQPVLRVVDDQHGCPTFADHLAPVLIALAGRGGIWHACGEPASRYGLALAIVEALRARCEVVPVPTAAMPTPARRPLYSVLDVGRLAQLGITLPSWRAGLSAVLETS